MYIYIYIFVSCIYVFSWWDMNGCPLVLLLYLNKKLAPILWSMNQHPWINRYNSQWRRKDFVKTCVKPLAITSRRCLRSGAPTPVAHLRKQTAVAKTKTVSECWRILYHIIFIQTNKLIHTNQHKHIMIGTYNIYIYIYMYI